MAQWAGDFGQAIMHLQVALALAQEIGLPDEGWPILGALGGLYAAQGEQALARGFIKKRPLLSGGWLGQLMRRICGPAPWRLARCDPSWK